MGFSERFPRWITALIAVAQLLLTAAIIGLEVWSAYIDLAHGTIWVGFWSGIVFLITVFLMLCLTVCCRGRCYAFYVLIFNVLSGLLAIAIIYFDQLFMNNLCKCFLGDLLCCAVRSIPTVASNYTAIYNDCSTAVTQGTISSRTCPAIPYDKLNIIKAQLGCGAGMLGVCAFYVVLFVFACFGICFGHGK